MIKQNILIIDDNAKNIQLAATVLKQVNLYNIFFATSGKKGIEQLKLRKHSLILLDVNMPELDGYETADIIKQDANHKKIPIIFLSANTNKESIVQGFEHNGADYITKPFEESELIHRVRTHVELFLAKEQLQEEVDDTKILLEQYKMAVDASALVSKTDLDGIITYVNDEFCKVSQYSKGELIGQSHNIVRSKDVPKTLYKKMWDTITGKKIWHGILKNIKKDGTLYYVDANIIPILNAKNEITEYISLRKNITKEIELKNDILATQKEVLSTLGELGESHSKETGDHVNRVAHMSEVLAKAYGCSEEEVALLKMASPMHDIGKVVIPDAILLKPAKLTSDEFEVMKQHTIYGWEIFKKSKHKLLKTAAAVAYEHHERWDGEGYPRALRGEEIHIFGRITAVCDVFDALCSKRVYKDEWTLESALEFMKSQSGKAFEPKLIELFLENIDEIVAIKKKFNK